MRTGNDTLQDAATSMGASFNLPAIWLGHICNYSIQLVFTGTPNGTFKLQASNDLGGPGLAPTNWTDVANSSQAITAAGDHMWQVENAGYKYVRVVYTRSSSTGSLTVANFNVKGV